MVRLFLLYSILYIHAIADVEGGIVDVKERQCKNGDYSACDKAGEFYEVGSWVKRDYFKAFEFYKKSCDHDIAMSCNSLGQFYYFGLGVKQNKKLSLKYYGKACDLKEQLGCQNYSELLTKLSEKK